eukprot:gene2530-4924_t
MISFSALGEHNIPQATIYSSIPGFEYSPIGRWSSRLFCCMGQLFPSLFMSTLCTCVMAGQVSEKLGLHRCRWVATVFAAVIFITTLVYTQLPQLLIFVIVIWSFLFYLAMNVRTKTRDMFNIPGDSVSDSLSSCLCTCCVISQVARHIYGYRGVCDGGMCSSNGTPEWQISPRQDNVTDVEVGSMQSRPIPCDNNAVNTPEVIIVDPSQVTSVVRIDDNYNNETVAVASSVLPTTSVYAVKYTPAHRFNIR